MRIGRDVEQRKIGESRITELDTGATAANGDGQAVGDFEALECRHDRAVFSDHFKYLPHGVRGLFGIDPRECRRTVEDQAHGRP